MYELIGRLDVMKDESEDDLSHALSEEFKGECNGRIDAFDAAIHLVRDFARHQKVWE